MSTSTEHPRTGQERLVLPVLPLRDVVVFPHMVIPLFVGRDKSIRALDLAMEGDKRILLVAQKSAETDDPGAADLHPIGTLAQVLQLLKLPDGTIKVLVEGLTRAHVDAVGEVDGTLSGTGVVVESADSREPRELDAIARSLMGLFEQYIKTNRKLPPELLQTLSGIDDPSRLADTIAAHIGVRLGDKQKLLETLDTAERLEMLVGLVDGEIDVQQMEKRIRDSPSTSTLMVPSGSFSSCSTCAIVPMACRSPASGSSVSAAFCATSRMRLSPSTAMSSARIDFSRPTNSGITMCGNTTTSRSGNTGSTGDSDRVWAGMWGTPLRPRRAGAAMSRLWGCCTRVASGLHHGRTIPFRSGCCTSLWGTGGRTLPPLKRESRPKAAFHAPAAAGLSPRTRPWPAPARSGRSGTARTCVRLPTRPPPPC